jgi:aromatic-amino-acid transaminase
MLDRLQPQAPDKIIALMAEYAADPRPGRIDLGVGVYRDATGRTPIPRAVKAAEERLWREQTTKTYKGLIGDLPFIEAMRRLVLGESVAADRTAGAQAPGGTGALRLLFELVQRADRGATVWHSDPTWPNHLAILAHLGIPVRPYRYFDAASRDVDRAGMMADLAAARPGDVLLLHGCCHNPTGADLSLEDWQALGGLCNRQGLIPLVDMAYQGFGDGLEADAAPLRALAAAVPELLVAASCSKIFGVYRDRAGVALVVAATPAAAALARENLTTLNRVNYSFPPDHGAAVVASVLTDAAFRADWEAELEAMRLRMRALRQGLAAALRRETNDGRFDFLTRHRGMFSRLGATPEQVAALKRAHGIYMVGDGRINVAGLPEDRLGELARAFVAAGL